MSNVSNLKIGDKVLQSSGHEQYSIGRIIGETKTSWKVMCAGQESYLLYKKTSGWLRGGYCWSSNSISPFDQSEWDEIQKEHECKVLRNKMYSFTWGKLELPALKAIEKIYNDAITAISP